MYLNNRRSNLRLASSLYHYTTTMKEAHKSISLWSVRMLWYEMFEAKKWLPHQIITARGPLTYVVRVTDINRCVHADHLIASKVKERRDSSVVDASDLPILDQ